jgi:hypothetical protein
LRARLILLIRSLTVVLSFLKKRGAIVLGGRGMMVVVVLGRKWWELRGFDDLVVCGCCREEDGSVRYK